MKKLVSMLLVIATLFSLTACGGSSKSEAMYSAGAMVEEAAPEAPAMMAAGASDKLTSASANGSTAIPENRKWIITIHMDAETEDLDSLLSSLDAEIAGLNGFVEDQNIHNGSNYASRRYRSANLTIRIPADKLDAFIGQPALFLHPVQTLFTGQAHFISDAGQAQIGVVLPQQQAVFRA